MAVPVRYVNPSEFGASIVQLASGEAAVLEQLSRKIAAGESLENLMQFAWDETREICPGDRMGLAFLVEEGRRLVNHWTGARYEPLLLQKGYSDDLRGSSLEVALQRERTRIIDDLPAYLAAHPQSQSSSLIVQEGVRSSLTSPLIVEGRALGFIFRSALKPRAFTERHIRMQRAFAERIAPAVDKAYRIEQLTAARDAYLDVLGFVSHELKNPLASLVTDGRVLTGGYLGQLNDPQQQKIEKMIQKGEYLLDLIRRYLDMARIESGEMRMSIRRGVDVIAEIVEPAIDLIAPQLEQQQMRVSRMFPDMAIGAECDPPLLKIVLVNLLGNAVRYGNRGGQVRVHVNRTPRRLDLSVWNEGVGFTQPESRQLFRKFSRLPTAETIGRRGTGLGLYISWRIVQLHHGRIWASSEKGRWAEFSVQIPQPLAPADLH
ncbi:MAG: HAMP domain-containing histidine kinase [Acidobacteria bacterium]|nr:HAMP domain-containing histidine kinase [Acidobacteriota bacterium]